jgi:uncharacterized membrane protein
MYSRKYIIILIYIILILLIFLNKPSIMFDHNGNIKHFGYSNDNDMLKSLLSIEIVIPILVILSYIIYLSIQLIT